MSDPYPVSVPEPPTDLVRGPTRLDTLDLSETDGHDAEAFVKRDDRTGGPAQGNKLRKLEYLLGDAADAGADVLVTGGGVQSNHCRATAVVAAERGLDCHLVLLGEEPEEPDGNLLLSRVAGADVEYCPWTEFSGDLDNELGEAADRLREAGCDPFVVPLGGSTARGSLGYVRAYAECRRQAAGHADADVAAGDAPVDSIHVATGSGGTLAGLVAGALLAGDDTDVVGVDVTPYGATYLEQVVTDLVHGVGEELDHAFDDAAVERAVTVRSGYVGPGYGEPAEADAEAIVAAGRDVGLVLDPTYTGKAFRAFREHLADADAGRHLFVHTGGSYGLFPKREAVGAALERAEREDGR
ncbi:1-aminocyclopropane-1-carboxylate deaminase/D-cysteine desulfhydrase [Haloglomus salinum]|jgi:D-cysteine desulfhydrase|uniref:1-aminocyclopropane-1-carboxylate deaminase/D-cysteine desulfhydrase n=1 Tax=Haloglomus salinum TaxID=2962673 RepID=UPI0020C954D7|nr:pyridoxal-phosphate dependent enzyme [Haloglomus salinum]